MQQDTTNTLASGAGGGQAYNMGTIQRGMHSNTMNGGHAQNGAVGRVTE